MAKVILLDTGVLGMIIHPRPNTEILKWIERLGRDDAELWISEIVDYELRRKLIHLGFTQSIYRLDALKAAVNYIPITTDTMLRAAELWAEARKQGKPTAGDTALDVDMILSAQAVLLNENRDDDDVIIATGNVGHLSLFADARLWQDIL